MKRPLPFTAITIFACAITTQAENLPAPDKPLQAKINELRKQKILTTLAEAQTIVLCDFPPPKSFTVRKVLRGKAKVGELRNSVAEPPRPLLIYERFQIGDLNGGTISSTGSYPLAGLDKIILSDADGATLPIDEVEKYLQEHPVEQAAGTKPPNR